MMRRATRQEATGGKKAAMPREEWDFSKCPKEQLYECYCYEFARESKSYRRHVDSFRANAGAAKTFDDFFAYSQTWRQTHREDGMPENLHPGCMFNFSPEFPDTPFLSIKEDERKRRLCIVRQLDRDGKDLLNDSANFQRIPWPLVFSRGREYFTTPRKNRKRVAFDINWSLSEAQLVEMFRDWVRKKREWEQRERSGVSVGENRGGGGPQRQYASRLKHLGALRLSRHTGNDWNEAAGISELDNKKSIYVNQSEWIRARQEAEKIIANEFKF